MKWVECEAISFNDVQDKSAWQQLLRQCVQQPRGRAQRQYRQAVTVYAAATQQASCGAHVRPRVTDLSTLLSAQATCLSGVNYVSRVTRHTIEHVSPRKPAMNLRLLGYFSAPELFLIPVQTVYLTNAVSHITEFSPCSIMSLESAAHLIHRFIPKLEVKQTPDKAVACSQPVL